MCLFVPVSAEYVHLTDGLIIKGKIIQITEKGIVIETAQGKRKNIKKSQIIKITKKLPVNTRKLKTRKINPEIEGMGKSFKRVKP